MAKVFLAYPYCDKAHVSATLSAYHGASPNKGIYVVHPLASPPGAHAYNFNFAWCMALNTRKSEGWTHCAMIHSDVECDDVGWLDVMLGEMDRVKADVLSVVLPIKDKRGLSSTALQDRRTLRTHRLTMKELDKLPETFDAAGAGEPHSTLFVSTGLWICRFTEPWVEQCWFETRDRLGRLPPCEEYPDGRFVPLSLSEDYNFSRQLAELDLRVFATKKVKARHWGNHDYINWKPWGMWSYDEDASVGEWLTQLPGLSALEELENQAS